MNQDNMMCYFCVFLFVGIVTLCFLNYSGESYSNLTYDFETNMNRQQIMTRSQEPACNASLRAYAAVHNPNIPLGLNSRAASQLLSVAKNCGEDFPANFFIQPPKWAYVRGGIQASPATN